MGVFEVDLAVRRLLKLGVISVGSFEVSTFFRAGSLWSSEFPELGTFEVGIFQRLKISELAVSTVWSF